MPIYEYHCDQCGKDFEYLVFGGQAPTSCPLCQSAKVQRLMSACGFVSKSAGGQTVSRSAGASACAGCHATSCSTCGH